MRRLALLALVLLVAGAAPAAATPPGGNGKIAFVADAPGSDEDAHVWAIDPDGGNLTDLTPSLRSFPWSVAWSPDGSEIAYTLPKPDASNGGEFPLRWSLNLMDADGGNQREIHVFEGFLPTVSWSPDGEQIAYPGLTTNSLQIFSVRRDGTDLVQHTSFRLTFVFAPAWSPDGARFAFSADFTPWTDERIPLWSIAVDGTDRRRLSRRTAIGADWSPDGTRVLSTFDEGVRAVNVDGSGTQLLTRLFAEWLPAWSPDGSRIVLPAEPLDGAFDPYTTLVTMNVDGTCPVTVLDASVHAPSWAAVPGGAATPEERCADLAVTTDRDQDHARTGRLFTLRARVRNAGNEPAPDSELTYPLPRRWSADSATSTHGACAGARTVVCDLGTLGPGEQADVVLRVRASRSRTQSTSARVVVTTSAPDPVALDDRAGVPFVRICDRLGTPGRDRLVGSQGPDVICGLEGDDIVRGRGGDDFVLGGPGHDVIFGGRGADVILALGGADRIVGGGGDDWIEPGPGRDRAFGGRGDDLFQAWDRYSDLLDGGPGRDWARDHDGFDILRSIERRRFSTAAREPARARTLADAAGLTAPERAALARAVLLDRWEH